MNKIIQWKTSLVVQWLRICLGDGDKKDSTWGFPTGSVVKNPPANAGDTGLIPDPRRSHMPGSNKAHVPQLLRLCSRAREPQLLSSCAVTTEACAPQSLCSATGEAIAMRSLSTATRAQLPLAQLEKSPHGNKDPAQTKINT